MNPYDRQPGEPNRWFDRYERFRKAGAQRSVLAAYNAERAQVGKSARPRCASTWDEACARWQWRARAEAWDEHLRQEDNRAWAARREELRNREWAVSEALLKKAQDMLVFPVAKVTREDEGKITVIEPAEWRMGDIPKVADTGSKLARLAAGLATERKDTFEWSWDDCTPDQLARLASGEDPRLVFASRPTQGTGRLDPPATESKEPVA